MGGPDQGERRQRGLIGDHSSSISPLTSCERPIPPSVTVALAGNRSLPLSLPSAKAWRTAFSISRWALTPSVLRNFRMLVLNTSSFMIASFTPLYLGTRRRSAAFAAPDCNDNSPFASTSGHRFSRRRTHDRGGLNRGECHADHARLGDC